MVNMTISQAPNTVFKTQTQNVLQLLGEALGCTSGRCFFVNKNESIQCFFEIIDFVGNNPPIRPDSPKLILAAGPRRTESFERQNMAKLRFLNISLRISKGYQCISFLNARDKPPNTDRSQNEHPQILTAFSTHLQLDGS